jgi:hypothetical protein
VVHKTTNLPERGALLREFVGIIARSNAPRSALRATQKSFQQNRAHTFREEAIAFRIEMQAVADE